MGEKTDKIKGRVKHAAGVLSDDERLAREGRADEQRGNLKGAVRGAKKVGRNIKEAIKDAGK